jgi:hypothetical protein
MQTTLFNIKSVSDQKAAEKLRQSAEALTSQIEAKRNPAIAQQNPTARRARIAASMREDADRMELIQGKLCAMADGIEEGNLPDSLQGIRIRAVVEMLVNWYYFPRDAQSIGQLERSGIRTEAEFEQAKKEMDALGPRLSSEPTKEKLIAEMEMELLGRKIPGYFPTPENVVSEMLMFADIRPGMKALEPSAGKGNIAEVIRERHPELELSVIELNHTLREILTLKDFSLVDVNFLEHSENYDLIVMNPPFEQGQDIDHLYHAFKLLRDDGRVVSIMCEGPFFRNDRKSKEFREWLDRMGFSQELPAGSFKPSGTGVNTRIVVVDK